MKRNRKNIIGNILKSIGGSAVLALFLLSSTVVSAQTEKTQSVDVSSPGFKLTVCDGPAELNQINPQTGLVEAGRVNDPNFVPCDFNGAMMQAQHLINVFIVVGVLAAMIGFVWSGILYISGDPGKIKKAHQIFPRVFFGFIIMLSAWFIVFQILSWLTNNPNFMALLGKNQ